ncbi:Molybdopterin synthase catalytic subunit [Liparis tanakae]|uniref:Molybdopterin synthase catalytic subunit n=1 Tax=Liparis tanakae TaxID=230148 RepID=A0A4Z2IPL9_9TELE|nr:Molybdopterin synthase catalytic subunit [Liparis tanakae]
MSARVCVLYFAKSVELTGVKEEELVAVPTPISSQDLWELLLQRHPRWVKVGEASVVVAISSPHRHDGQQAIGHVVEQLKARVPIWKKEVYDTQETSWKENAECPWAFHNKGLSSTPSRDV